MPPVFAPPGTDVRAIRSSMFSHVMHGISTRHGGVSPAPYDTLNLGMSTLDDERNVLENRARFFAAVAADDTRILTGRLTHGREVSVFRRHEPHTWPLEIATIRKDSTNQEEVFRTDG